ncbi:hypothetical protein [Streptomyces sp. NPDC058612]|uniref:hypothetical protein n=1 Tax=Streptomyces sp. NPDC058612 TaxID=3346555 RepID=UPI003666AB07
MRAAAGPSPSSRISWRAPSASGTATSRSTRRSGLPAAGPSPGTSSRGWTRGPSPRWWRSTSGRQQRIRTPERRPRRWTWHAFALGDSCLFHLRDGQLITSFPIADADGFGITPQLLGSRNRDAALITERASTATGELRTDDELLLATDALAAWLLSHPEIDSGGPGKQLGKLADLDQETFADWVQNQRDKSRMRNDDVALIRMRVKTEG